MCLFLLSTSLYSEFHRSSVAWMLPRPLTLISKFLGVGPNFHDFNESKQQWNEARRLGTCTDTLTRREKNDSLALSSTATTYVDFSVLDRLTSSLNVPHFQYLSACVRRSIHVKRLTAKHSLGLRQWKSATTIYTTLRKALSTHRGAAQSTTWPKPCIRIKAPPPPPLPCYGIRPNPCLCTQCVVCVNIDTCNVQLKHAQFVLLLVSN